jgi:hypothetical protein
MIKNVRRQIYTVGDDGPPPYKMPAMAWETKERVENTKNWVVSRCEASTYQTHVFNETPAYCLYHKWGKS